MDQPAIRDAVAAGAELVGDIELFARALPVQTRSVLAVTGTNGKTTVTSLTGALPGPRGLRPWSPATSAIRSLDEIVALRGRCGVARGVRARAVELPARNHVQPEAVAATVLNVSAQDHLDRYSGIADYASAKARIFANAGVQILNRDDPIVRLMRQPGRTVQTFGAGVPLSEEEWGLVERAGSTWLARGGELIMETSRLALVGRHNAMNALAALALACSVAKPGRVMHEALAQFGGLPHRMAPIADANGVLYIDDSKGTTVAATQVALDGIGRRVVLIAGGDGKGQSFVPLRESVDRACRAVLLIGRDAQRVADGIKGTSAQVEILGTLERAVERAVELAKPGDAVLLSPACASLDQFHDYVERGLRFADLVRDHVAMDADA